MAGRPKGAENKDKEWREEIRLAVHELRAADGDTKADKVKALRLLARRLVDKALGGDVAAMKEIGDRLDGKAVQGVELAGPDGPVKVDINIIEVGRKVGFAIAAAAEAVKKPTDS